MIYTFSGMKFSKAKSIAALQMAKAASKDNKKILFIEADAGFANEQLKRTKLPNIDLTIERGSGIGELINNKKELYEDIFIDCGHGIDLEVALKYTDFLNIPFQSKDKGLWTVWTLANMESVLRRAWDHNPELTAYSYILEDENKIDKNLLTCLKKNQYIKYSDEKVIN